MTREEYIAVLENEPATSKQRGAIMGECARLGFTGRAERLAVLAALLDLDELESTAELTLGQAGRLVNVLQHTRYRAELPAALPAVDDGGQDDEHSSGTAAVGLGQVTLVDALGQIVVMLWQLFGPGSEPRESGNPAASRESDSSD